MEAPLENTRFSSHPFHRIAEFAAQVRDIEATHVAQLDPCELLPEPLARVEVRGIGRQTLHVQPVGRLMRQELLEAMATVDGSAIPDDDHLAGDLAQQVLEKRDDVVRVEGVVLAVEVQLAFW